MKTKQMIIAASAIVGTGALAYFGYKAFKKHTEKKLASTDSAIATVKLTTVASPAELADISTITGPAMKRADEKAMAKDPNSDGLDEIQSNNLKKDLFDKYTSARSMGNSHAKALAILKAYAESKY